MRTVTLFTCSWLASLVCFLIAGSALAEPYIAQREGYRCSRCHVNATGGGMRTAFGRQYAITHLSLLGSDPAPVTGERQEDGEAKNGVWSWLPLDPTLNDTVSVGGNVRVTNTTAFAKQAHNTFGNPEANIYALLEALGHVKAYVDTSLAEGNVEAREAFAMGNLWGFYVKAGYFLQPFGLRIWGDEEFIRKETGFTFASPDLGLEAGFEWHGLGIAVALSNGAGGGLDVDNDKRVSALVDWADELWRFGGSFSHNTTNRRVDTIFGGHAGINLGRLTVLGEVDALHTTYVGNNANVMALVAYAEGDLLLRRGLHLKVAYGYHDPALDIPQNHRIHVRSSVEIFPIPMVAASVFYDVRMSVPQDELGNADLLGFELHLFL